MKIADPSTPVQRHLLLAERELFEQAKGAVKMLIALTAERHPSISADAVYDIVAEGLSADAALSEILAHLPDEDFDVAFNAGRS